MQADDIAIMRTAGLFIARHGVDAPRVAERKFAEMTEAGYKTSAETAMLVLAAIARQIGGEARCGG
jgi:hypothetical protein